MGDPAQTAIFLVIIVLTVLLVALGIQVFFILRDLRKTVSKANKVLDDTEVITHSVSSSISSLSSITTGIKTGAAFINLFKKILTNDKAENKKNKERKNG